MTFSEYLEQEMRALDRQYLAKELTPEQYFEEVYKLLNPA